MRDSVSGMRMRVWGMRKGISFTVSPTDRARLTALIRDRNAPQKHVWRAEIVLLSADGIGTIEIMRRTGKSKTCVWRWQERFATQGFGGLLRDKTRPSRIPPLGPEVADRVVWLGRRTFTAQVAGNSEHEILRQDMTDSAGFGF